MSKQAKITRQRKDGQWENRYIEETIDEKFNTDTFDNLSREWLHLTSPQLKASSIAKYTNMLNSYLIPGFGVRQVSNISRNDIVLFSRELLVSGGMKANGLAPKTVNSIISLMKNILEYAAREKGISVANTKGISVRQPGKPMRILSRIEQQKLSEYLYDNLTPCHLGILLCMYTGLRIGEICALKWKNICATEQYLHVHQTMQRIQTGSKTGKKTEIVIQPPKSDCSIRKIPIPDEIFRLLLPAQKQEDAFLLTGMVHNFIEPRSMENHFKAAARMCDICNVNFHALRHTFATRCVELGFDIKSLSEILGHASVNITLNRYVHPSMELKQKNMNMLSEFLTLK